MERRPTAETVGTGPCSGLTPTAVGSAIFTILPIGMMALLQLPICCCLEIVYTELQKMEVAIRVLGLYSRLTLMEQALPISLVLTAIRTDGTSFTNLYNFTTVSDVSVGFMHIETNSDGALPEAAICLSDNTLYGTTAAGGIYGDGALFALSLGPIILSVQGTDNDVILTWENPAFSLQAAPFVNGIYTNIPSATSPFTNTIIGPQQFFRLRSN